VSRAKRTTLKARGPDITLNIARPVSVFINLQRERKRENDEEGEKFIFICQIFIMNNLFQSISPLCRCRSLFLLFTAAGCWLLLVVVEGVE
jgi:hypothetical protein